MKKRWSWTHSVNGSIDIVDARRPNVLFAAAFITSIRMARVVCAALNAMEPL